VATANISSSRYMMIVLAPKERLSEFFGLFALSSTATVWLGPTLTEFATRASGDQRIGFSPVLLLLAVGLLLMLTLKKESSERPAPNSAAPPH
jgi:MFS transporter, UMF1 family